MSLYDRALSLLEVRESRSRFYGGRRGGRGDTTRGGPGWSNKDMYGSSSIASRNRRIYNQQVSDKTREAYQHDVRKQITNDIQGENSNTPLTQAQKEERDNRVNEAMKDYDNDPKKQRDARGRYQPQLSSSERSRQRQNQQQQEKDNAREAVRDYVKEQEQKAKDSGKPWTHDDAEKARKEAKQQQEKEKEKEPSDSEEEAKTADKAAEKEAEATQDPNLTVQQQLNQLQQQFNQHIGNPSAHHTPYYA